MTSESLTFRIPAPSPFSLDPVKKLACGFLRGSRSCGVDEVKVAFPLDGTFEVVGVTLRATDGMVEVRATRASKPEVLRAQVARFLTLDHDVGGWARVLAADPVLAGISAKTPGGFRPVVAYSPYVMAGWSVLSQRVRMTQAAAVQVRMSEAAGDVATVGGEAVASFPRPQSVLKFTRFAGVSDEKLRRLKAVAAAALDGKLEVAALRALPFQVARSRLMEIRGVGAWTADAILMRGCGPLDALPLSEKTLHGAIANAYGLDAVPDDDEVDARAKAWAPFRMWASVMLIANDFEAARARLAASTPGGRRAGPRERTGGRPRATTARSA